MSAPVDRAPIEETTVPALDGLRLAASLALPSTAAEPVGLVLVASAAGVPRRYYGPFISHLARAGFAALSFDYRGVGGSRPASLRGFAADLHDWGERDIPGAIAWLGDRFPSRPLLVVGHSVGGQVLGLAPSLERVAALLTIASQSGYWRLWRGARRLQMALYFHLLIPLAARAAGYLPMSMLGAEDLPRDVALEWARWSRDPRYVLGHARRRAQGPGSYERFDRPWRAYAFTDDPYAPEAAVRELLAFYPRARSELRLVSPAEAGRAIGHFGFFRPEHAGTLWPDVVEWLRTRSGGH